MSEFTDLVRLVNRLQGEIDDLVKPEVGGIWTDWTPTITQSVSVSITINRAKYAIINKVVIIQAEVTMTSAGVAANAIEIGGIPATVQPTGLIEAGVSILGVCSVLDTGTKAYYGFTVAQTSSTFRLRDSNTQFELGLNPSFALVSTDRITFRACYEH